MHFDPSSWGGWAICAFDEAAKFDCAVPPLDAAEAKRQVVPNGPRGAMEAENHRHHPDRNAVTNGLSNTKL